MSESEPSAVNSASKFLRSKMMPEVDECQVEYEKLNKYRVYGLTDESLTRSRAWVGNQQRLVSFVEKLRASTIHNKDESNIGTRADPVNVVVCGGSISLGHGVQFTHTNRYSNLLEAWLNEEYPMTNDYHEITNLNNMTYLEAYTKHYSVNSTYLDTMEVHEQLVNSFKKHVNQNKRHRVHQKGAHGADMCALAKRLHLVLEDLEAEGVSHPDLFILEFAVNDYQGQDDKKHVESKVDVFFDGFEELGICAEIVLNKLLSLSEKTAIIFVEFRTGVLVRKTAQWLHMSIAQHYQIPVISYAEAIFPEYVRLIESLNSTDSFTIPTLQQENNSIVSTKYGGNIEVPPSDVLPYPYGCTRCQVHMLVEQFRSGIGANCGWSSICNLMRNSGEKCDQRLPPPNGREFCVPSWLDHDPVHPSALGHRIAKDLIVHTLTQTYQRFLCEKKSYAPHILPQNGWLVNSIEELKSRGDFIFVNDTQRYFSRWDELKPSNHSPGWDYYSDVKRPLVKKGWISNSTAGQEIISFDIDLPQSNTCYIIYLAVLRSYSGMGKFQIRVTDLESNKTLTQEEDGLWLAPISVWSDIKIGDESQRYCCGRCQVNVLTHPLVEGRDGNKVKILTLSARRSYK